MLACSVFDTAWGAFGYVAEGAALVATYVGLRTGGQATSGTPSNTYLPGLTKARGNRQEARGGGILSPIAYCLLPIAYCLLPPTAGWGDSRHHSA